jgi:hypothetical protein
MNEMVILIFKGVAIFLVIFGYALQYGSGSAFLSGGWYWDARS